MSCWSNAMKAEGQTGVRLELADDRSELPEAQLELTGGRVGFTQSRLELGQLGLRGCGGSTLKIYGTLIDKLHYILVH